MSLSFILLSMMFCHIVDDYYLQGWLASAKQKKWWQDNAPDKLYKYDYIMALFMHSFSWSFMIMIVPTIYFGKNIITLFILNLIVHMFTDNLKANMHTINLIEDQLIHLVQIIVTFCCFVKLFT